MKYKTTLEIETDGNSIEVPPMTSGNSIPQYEAVGGLAENHPGRPKGSDTVPAWLTPGEFVVNKEATDLFGPQIEQMNNIGRELQENNIKPNQVIQPWNMEIPTYAEGGQGIADTSWITGDLISKLAYIESDNIHRDKSKAGQYGYDHTGLRMSEGGAYGKYQWTVKSAANPGYNIKGFDPREVTEEVMREKTIEYLKGIQNANPDWTPEQVLRAYNQGPGKTREMITGKWEKDPRSKNYGKDILNEDGTKTFRGMGLDSKSDGLWGGITEEARDYPFKVLSGDKNATMYGTRVENKDGTVTLKNFPESMLPVSKPTGVEIPTANPSQSGDGWSLFDFFRGSNANSNLSEDVTVADINEVGGVPHTEMPIPEVPINRPNALTLDQVREQNPEFKSEFINYNKGGEIPQYHFWGDEVFNQATNVGRGTFHPDPEINEALRQAERMVRKDIHGYKPGVSGEDLGYAPTVPYIGPEPIPDIPMDSILSTTNEPENEIANVPYSGLDYQTEEAPELSANFMGMGEKDYRNIDGEWYRIKEDGTLASSPVSSIQQMNLDTMQNQPPPPSEEEIKLKAEELASTVGLAEHKPITPTAQSLMIGADSPGTAYTSFEDIKAAKERDLNTAIDTAMNAIESGNIGAIATAGKVAEDAAVASGTANITAATNNTNDKKWKNKYAINHADEIQGQVDTLTELENNAIENGQTNLANAYNQAKENKLKELDAANANVNKTAEELHNAEVEEKFTIQNNITQEAANVIEETTGEKIIPGGSDKNIIKAAEKIDDNTVEKIAKDLSDNAKIAKKAGDKTTAEGKHNWDKAKGMFNWLFGDLIDGKELGRAIAVYLGSRALGYDHNSSIGYIAKNYLKRVDTKNAKMDAFIKANIGKFEKGSLAEYKRTGDPSVLIPVGSVARPQGDEPKRYYSKEYPKGRWAYKFKKKLPSGEDIIYWSYDQAGKSRVGKGHHTDAKRVPNTIEYRERIQKNAKIIQNQLKELVDQEGIGRIKTGETKSGVAKWQSLTGIMPANHAQDVAVWAEENGYDLSRLGSGLTTAFAMMSEKAKKSKDGRITESSIIPYLEEATIKERLIGKAAELTQARVGDEIVHMDEKKLMSLNDEVKKISKSLGMHPDTFWGNASALWTDTSENNKNYKKTGKTWKEIYQEEAKKEENEGYTPFALFAKRIMVIKASS